MEIFKINSIYSKVNTNLKKKPYQILRNTKTIALSNPKFRTFYKSCENLFEVKTFKLPDESTYPKLKINQYVSLNKKIKTFDLDSKKTNNKSQIRPKSATTSIKNNLYEKYKKKKNVNFFLAENISKKRFNLSSQRFNSNSKSQNNIISNDYDYQGLYQLYSIKNTEKRVKDFFMLLNSIFYDDDSDYKDLIYNEKEIFGHKDEYLNYLKDELNYFLKREKEFDIKSELLQIFLTKKYGKIELFLKSARIEIIEINNKNEKDNENTISINIPFNLMCLIYLCNGEQINYITLMLLKQYKILKIKELAENIIIYTEEQKKQIFMEILYMVKLENNGISFSINQKNYENYNTKLKFLEAIKDITDVTKYNNFLNSFYKNQSRIKIVDNSLSDVYNTPKYKSNKNMNIDTNLNKYTLNCLSAFKKYKVHFKMPEIVLSFIDYKKQINHYIDKELFLYLYGNNFMYWDFYVLHYLFSYKSFRKFMNGILSIQSRNRNMNMNSKRNNYFLSKAKSIEDINSKNQKNKSKQIENIISILTKNKYYLNDLYSYEIHYSLNCNEYDFLISNNYNLSIYRLKSYIIYVFFNNINKPIIYELNFNFQQMKILYYISLYENLNEYLKRLLFIKDDNIYFDYSYFDSFLNLSNKEIDEYFHGIHNLNKDVTTSQNQFNSLNLRICEPYFQVDNINLRSDDKIFHIKINKKFLEDLINTNINEWINVIGKHKNEFDFKNQIKYEDTMNKKIRRQITAGNKNKDKDLHKMFNKFL